MQFLGFDWMAVNSFVTLENQPSPPSGGEIIKSTVKAYSKAIGGTSTFCIMNDAGVELCLQPSGSSGLVTGSGVNQQVALWTGANTIGGNTKLVYDSTNTIFLLGSSIFQSMHPTTSTEYLQIFKDSTSVSGALQIGNNATASGTFIGEIDFGTRGASAAEKRGMVIASKLTAASGTNVTADGEFYWINGGTAIQAIQIGNGLSFFGDTTNPTKLKTNKATPTNADGDWWVDVTGTSPTRVAAIKVNDAGTVRTIASITF